MIIAIIGEEFFLVKKALTKLLDERCPQSVRDFNLDVYEAADIDAKRLAAGLGTLPMMAERRCVLIKNAHELRKSDMEALEPLLPQVPETTDLVFVGAKADNRFGFWKNLLKAAKVMEFKPLSPAEVPRWLTDQAKVSGYRLDADAAALIEAGVGTDLMALQSALEKLYSYVHPHKEIEASDVEACVTTFSWKNVFELTDAVARKNVERALKLFHEMSLSGESPIAFVALLARHFRILSKVKEGDTAGLFFKLIDDYKRQAASFTPQKLAEKRDRLFFADWHLKSSPLPARLVFERLVMDLCA